jgi:UDP-glucuronate 4-epimerase
MRYLVTGGAGFIGSHLCELLLSRGDQVICLDNYNDYYSPDRKRRNAAPLYAHPDCTVVEADVRDYAALDQIFAQYRPEKVAHLAAMANPRYSLEHPLLYEEVNVRGSLNLLTLAGRYTCKGFLLASTSSVYGLAPTPWTETTATDRPLSYYAGSKKSAEVLAYTAHRQYGTPTQIVRFFTVYGPRGRPDMTPSLFVGPMLDGRPITLFEGGVGVYRDWTYVGDIVRGVVAALDSDLGYEIFNLGNSSPVQLSDFIATLERITGLKALIDAKPLPAADPPITYAAVEKAGQLLGWEPTTSVEEGLARFWAWYQAEVLPTRRSSAL